jgi:hypothetical protein
MTPEQIYLNLIDKERNIYEPAQLFHQNREAVSNYINNMRSPGDNEGLLTIEGNNVKCTKNGKVFTKQDEVLDFIKATEKKPEDKLSQIAVGLYPIK